MSDMKKLLANIIPLAAMSLTGCVAAYTPPPASASTATLDIAIHNLFGEATLNIDTGLIQKQNLLTTPTVGQTVNTSATVGTQGPVRLTYKEFVGTGQCNLQFKFQPAPGQTYDLFVGDVAPAPATTGLGKFGQWLFPLAGKRCFAKAWQTQPDGTQTELRLQRALY